MEPTLIYTTSKDDQVFVIKGEKSPLDFIVKYQSPGKRLRTPKHIHIIVDLYAKLAGNEVVGMSFVDHILSMIENMSPTHKYPPSLNFFSEEQVKQFEVLENFGEYSIQFLLVVIELLMLQEKTNYPNGTLNLKLFQMIREKADIFSVVSTATFR